MHEGPIWKLVHILLALIREVLAVWFVVSNYLSCSSSLVVLSVSNAPCCLLPQVEGSLVLSGILHYFMFGQIQSKFF
jgi:hypothetical protein